MHLIHAIDLHDQPSAIRITRIIHRANGDPHPLYRFRLSDFSLHYIISGRPDVEIDGKRIDLKPGELLFGFPGQEFAMAMLNRHSGFHFHFELRGSRSRVIRSWLSEWGHLLGEFSHPTHLHQHSIFLPDQLKVTRVDELVELLSGMVRSQTSTEPAAQVGLKARLMMLLQLVTEEVKAALLKNKPQEKSSRSIQHVTRALHIIENQLAGPLTASEVSHTLRLNPDYLGRVFRHAIGESLGAYILRRRMVQAKNLLLGTEMTVKEVAAATGFRDALYFSRMFKRHEGFSPTEYVRRNSESVER